jgi:hypothetical protein
MIGKGKRDGMEEERRAFIERIPKGFVVRN